jgi:hypothetical protein
MALIFSVAIAGVLGAVAGAWFITQERKDARRARELKQQRVKAAAGAAAARA